MERSELPNSRSRPKGSIKVKGYANPMVRSSRKKMPLTGIPGLPPKHSAEKAHRLLGERYATSSSRIKWLLLRNLYHAILQPIPVLSHFQQGSQGVTSRECTAKLIPAAWQTVRRSWSTQKLETLRFIPKQIQWWS
ncbi:hypothetical protein N7490_006790 [Penicillium lividum]|nr:hypothetical protein N7490_006790 [Penicillium lividum]